MRAYVAREFDPPMAKKETCWQQMRRVDMRSGDKSSEDARV
jgi:hypothetical protein